MKRDVLLRRSWRRARDERDELLRDAGIDPRRVRVFESSEGYVYPLTRAEAEAAAEQVADALERTGR